MSRWGKNIVVPLDSLCKEKENTNRPTVARSVGTVGKWGKMGFTSTRTYALSALPAAVAAAAAAAAAAASPGQSPASVLDEDMSPSVPEPPKPKKFFKSRNTTPPEVIAQIIQHLPRAPTSPTRDPSAMPNYLSTPIQGREPIKLKIAKSSSAERKKKTPKKSPKLSKAEKTSKSALEETESTAVVATPPEQKQKKKKEEKKLKPEAPPSRVIARARKAVNYCEDDDERGPTPIKDIIFPKSKVDEVLEVPQDTERVSPPPIPIEPVLPPPAAPPLSSVSGGTSSVCAPAVVSAAAVVNVAAKTPEHPPIVLRISKGTSRLVSTDSEEQPNNTIASPQQHETEPTSKSRKTSTEEVPSAACTNTSTVLQQTTPKIIVKPPKPPSPEPPPVTNDNNDEASEINYCTVKISPDKPPKERLKLIIKKSKKHKHPKLTCVEQLSAVQSTVAGSEFKTPSPHLALCATNVEHQPHLQSNQPLIRTIISPPALSERDFDSQSSVLGSISSKSNSTPQPLAQTVHEESCVIHSRGSSVITSDLETSQHSSLVAPPSDIESRLESMMMDGEVSQRPTNLAEEEPLKEDILAVLRGEESQTNDKEEGEAQIKVNGDIAETENDVPMDEQDEKKVNRRVTRGRGRGAAVKVPQPVAEEEQKLQKTLTPNSRTRSRKATALNVGSTELEEATLPKRTLRRAKKLDETTMATVDTNESVVSNTNAVVEAVQAKLDKSEDENTTTPPTTGRRGRPTRNASNNNNLNSSNNNINKIAANLSAKAGAAEEAAKGSSSTSPLNAAAQNALRSYGRKRKNQQVTQVLQPSAEELEEHQPTPAKVASIDLPATLTPDAAMTTAAALTPPATSSGYHSQTPPLDLHDTNSNSNSIPRPSSTTPSSPPRRDYKIKDKFKRTLMLDNQVNCNAVVASPTANAPPTEVDQQQRGSVKLVISKKKGSIFKSRALVPSDQSEQSAATKRHLYKHRWDAEANGGTSSDPNASPTKSNDMQQPSTSRTAADAIFEDFSEDLSGGALSRGNSPLPSKLTRSSKANLQPGANPYDMDLDGPATEGASNAKGDRKAKDYYTVVRNVKTAHQIQEIGEYQEMYDDVEYILDALQPHNPTPTRCLSALQLATKCMTPAFRMHVRAHGVVTKFFKALSDANTDLSLGLCTSAIMYILSQEGLNMDLDRDALELMMNLMEAEGIAAPSDSANYERNQQKVRELCEEIKAQGKGTHLNVESITVGTLAMETLLSLTSKRAGEWFKEELRELGGLEHIIKTISDCCRPVIECNATMSTIKWTQSLLENMQTVERCMRVLENVTQMNEENQKYMINYAQGTAVGTLCTLYCLCDHELKLHPTMEYTTKENPGKVMRELLMPVMKVLINLSHTFNVANSLGADMLGQRADVIETSFHLLLQAPNYIPERCVFELSILVLLLLINLTMHNVKNRKLIMKAYAPPEFGTHYNEQQNKVTAIQAVMEYFYKCEELARLVEKNTDAFLDNQDKNKKKQEEVDETVNNLLQKAGHHMEHTLKGSYAGILIGHLITDSEEHEAIVRTHLRGKGFKEIISVLEKYYTFMNLTASSEASVVAHIKSTKKLIDYFKKRDLVYEMNDSNDCALPLNLETTHHNALTTTTATPSTTSSSSSPTATASASRSNSQRVYKTYSQR